MQMSAIDDELDTAKKISTDLVGPVYDADLSVNHFKEVVMHAEAIRQERNKILDTYNMSICRTGNLPNIYPYPPII